VSTHLTAFDEASLASPLLDEAVFPVVVEVHDALDATRGDAVQSLASDASEVESMSASAASPTRDPESSVSAGSITCSSTRLRSGSR
jgi:hypothetical protein